MAKRIIVHLVRVAGDPQDYLGSGVHIGAEGEEFGVVQELVTTVMSGSDGCLSGWDQDGGWVCIPARSIEAITVQGFDPPTTP